jgi:hypothetical protein
MYYTHLLLSLSVMYLPFNTRAQGIVMQMHVDTTLRMRPSTSSTVHFSQSQFIAPDHFTRNFGFFCRQELKLEKAHVPVHFRLGSMDLCNKLEDKPGYR